jgi:hypothetical protein
VSLTSAEIYGVDKMEIVIYVISVLMFLSSLSTLYRKRYSLLAVCYCSFSLFVVIPSFPTYSRFYVTEDMGMYFISMLIFQSSILVALFLSRSGRHPAPRFYYMRMARFSPVQQMVGIFITLTALVYLVVGARAYGGILPLVDFIRTGSFPVYFRMTFWRVVLPSIPMSSVFRFVAKTGTAFLGLQLIDVGRKRLGGTVLMLALLTTTMEGTKVGFLLWALPIIVYLLLNPNRPRLIVVLLGLIAVAGTLWTALLEAGFDWQIALSEKLLARAFVGPAHVSQSHFLLANQFRQWHSSDLYAVGISRLKGARLPLNALDWDNYVMRSVTLQRTGIIPTYGGMNAPGFIYGWVDYGLLGVIAVSVLSAYILWLMDDHIYKGTFSTVFCVSAVYQAIMLATSIRLSNSILGVEGVVGLLILDMCIGHDRAFIISRDMLLVVMAGLANYLIGGIRVS